MSGEASKEIARRDSTTPPVPAATDAPARESIPNSALAQLSDPATPVPPALARTLAERAPAFVPRRKEADEAAAPESIELTESERAGARESNAEQLIEQSMLGLGVLDDRALAERLETQVGRGNYALVLEVFDRLGERDRTRLISRARKALTVSGDTQRVATELAGLLTDFQLEQIAASRDMSAAALLDQLYYGLKHSGEEEVAGRSARVGAAKDAAQPLSDFTAVDENTLVLPYSSNNIEVTRLKDGMLAIRINRSRLLSPEVLGLDARLFNFPGLPVREDQILGIRDEDHGGRISYVRAHWLYQLKFQSLESFRRTAKRGGELALALGTLGLSAGAEAAANASLVIRAIRVLDSAAAIVSVMSPIVDASRDWLIEKLGAPAEAALEAFDLVDSVLRVYNLGRLAIDGASLVTRLVGRLDDLFAGSKALKLAPDELSRVEALYNNGRRLARDVDEIREVQRSAAQLNGEAVQAERTAARPAAAEPTPNEPAPVEATVESATPAQPASAKPEPPEIAPPPETDAGAVKASRPARKKKVPPGWATNRRKNRIIGPPDPPSLEEHAIASDWLERNKPGSGSPPEARPQLSIPAPGQETPSVPAESEQRLAAGPGGKKKSVGPARQLEIDALKSLQIHNRYAVAVIEGETRGWPTIVEEIEQALAREGIDLPLDKSVLSMNREQLWAEAGLERVKLRRELSDVGNEARRDLVGESAASMRAPIGGGDNPRRAMRPGHIVVHVPDDTGTVLIELYDPTLSPITLHNEKTVADAVALKRMGGQRVRVRAYDYLAGPREPLCIYDSEDPQVLANALLERSRLQRGVKPRYIQ